MPYPQTVRNHQAKLNRTTLALLLALQRLWRRLEPAGAWEQQYSDSIGPQILALTLAAQVSVTTDSDAHMAQLLNELAFGPLTQPGVVPPNAFTGLAGDGRPVETLLASAVGRARASEQRLRTRDVSADGDGSLTVRTASSETAQRQALADGEAFMAMVAASILSDTARAAEAAAMAPRPWVDGWVRVISPPCCSRCAILAGKFFLWNEGFLRHPRCDCKHIPAPAKGPELDQLLAAESPERYFDSLTEAEQNRTFTNDGAAAIRAGADIGQVVNARRGMSRAQVYGRDVLVTTEGTTRRGLAYDPLSRGIDRATDARRVINGRRQRVASTQAPRLMPEALAEIAGDDRDEFVRLLRLNGFIL